MLTFTLDIPIVKENSVQATLWLKVITKVDSLIEIIFAKEHIIVGEHIMIDLWAVEGILG